eukprot:3883182-Prymnesium_polylepis.1
MSGVGLRASGAGDFRNVCKAFRRVAAEFGQRPESGRTGMEAPMHRCCSVRSAEVVNVCGGVSVMDAAGLTARRWGVWRV